MVQKEEFRIKTVQICLHKNYLEYFISYRTGPNNWGIFLILPVTIGEGFGPAAAGEISPVVCMLKNGLSSCHFLFNQSPQSENLIGCRCTSNFLSQIIFL